MFHFESSQKLVQYRRGLHPADMLSLTRRHIYTKTTTAKYAFYRAFTIGRLWRLFGAQ